MLGRFAAATGPPIVGSKQPAKLENATGARVPRSDPRGTQRCSRIEGIVVSGVAIAAVLLALALTHPNVIGHDDGLYAALGRSLAENGEYRLISLPSERPETKYPPLYPALLASVWLVAPSAPANISALKAVNGILLGVGAVLFWRLLCRLPGSTSVQRVFGVALLISPPGAFSFTDLLTSEVAFLVGLLALMLAVPRDVTTASPMRLVCVGVVAGAMVLTRTAGLGIAAGAIWYLLGAGGPARAVVAVTALVGVTAPWFIWRALALDTSAGPLESYYLSYEASAWQRLLSDPALAWRILSANTAFYLETAPLVFGLYARPVGVVAALVAAVGTWQLPRGDRRLLGAIVLWYTLLVLGHPVPMERYLVPLLPLVILLLMAGTVAVRVRIGRRSTLADLAALTPLVLLLAGNLAWLQHYAATRSQGPQWHFGRRSAFSWNGFEEVFDWIRRNTPPKAVLATAYDPVYFLNTGRRAIRPWVHEPERYRTEYGWPRGDIPCATVSDELDRLGVTYLIVDPLGQDGESSHARRTIERLLAGSSSGEWIKVFETSNGQHSVYRRSR